MPCDNRGKTRTDLKCKGKGSSDSNKLTSELAGIGSKSDDLRGFNRTRPRTSSSVTQVEVWKTSSRIRRIRQTWAWGAGAARRAPEIYLCVNNCLKEGRGSSPETWCWQARFEVETVNFYCRPQSALASKKFQVLFYKILCLILLIIGVVF